MHTLTVSLHAHTYHMRLTPCTLSLTTCTQSLCLTTCTNSHCLTTCTHHSLQAHITPTLSHYTHTPHIPLSHSCTCTHPLTVSLHAHTTHSHCLTTCTHHTVSLLMHTPHSDTVSLLYMYTPHTYSLTTRPAKHHTSTFTMYCKTNTVTHADTVTRNISSLTTRWLRWFLR